MLASAIILSTKLHAERSQGYLDPITTEYANVQRTLKLGHKPFVYATPPPCTTTNPMLLVPCRPRVPPLSRQHCTMTLCKISPTTSPSSHSLQRHQVHQESDGLSCSLTLNSCTLPIALPLAGRPHSPPVSFPRCLVNKALHPDDTKLFAAKASTQRVRPLGILTPLPSVQAIPELPKSRQRANRSCR